ncbi:hypothetical protein KNT87_gp280 [Erwinia phage Cronus]|uniref:Uncharacterized protein n=1 Tax=Erwinia phage Cronus TaxID=2163633 RepID=A0A2S1GMH7_9CAUD|nr:hypothetical protein KNT87_gp280 [Erwinia phage Cronus]AWD90580.1 hypothetical protein [Erwinia phage Cronus]
MYYLFTFSQYYPQGGMNDCKGDFESIEAAREAAVETMDETYQIVSFNNGYCIEDYGSVESLK